MLRDRLKEDGLTGEHLMTCSICSGVFSSKYMRKDRNGLWCCTVRGHIEDRFVDLPQANIRPAVPVKRPQAFPDYGFTCFAPCIAGLAIPGCTTVGIN